ncbi:MAG: WbqC family protein [Gammaproteobacteria bacterium]|nr:WbqC family protein [Gammaproteobacteria bacterium]
MKIAILQPGYLPWLGFFEQMALVDLFVYMDDVQYTKRDWRNRNKINRRGSEVMLTVPVVKPRRDTLIKDVDISNTVNWRRSHLDKIRDSYRYAPYFHKFFNGISKLINSDVTSLCNLNVKLVDWIRNEIGIETPIVYSSEVPKGGSAKNERILEICKYFDADILYDGASAKNFIDEEFFYTNEIKVIFQNYVHPVYSDRKEGFLPYMSILDLLMFEGDHSKSVILSSPAPSFVSLK